MFGHLGFDLVRAWSALLSTLVWKSLRNDLIVVIWNEILQQNLIFSANSKYGNTIQIIVINSWSRHLIFSRNTWFNHIILYKVSIVRIGSIYYFGNPMHGSRSGPYILQFWIHQVLLSVVIVILCTHWAYGVGQGFYLTLSMSVLSGLMGSNLL